MYRIFALLQDPIMMKQSSQVIVVHDVLTINLESILLLLSLYGLLLHLVQSS